MTAHAMVNATLRASRRAVRAAITQRLLLNGVTVGVVGPVIVAVHVHWNDTVGVIGSL
jgi:hypothetical protein